MPVNFSQRNLHWLQQKCIIIKSPHRFIMLIRSTVLRPTSNREQKYEPWFPLLLSADDQFPRNYFKPCWPHTVYQRQDMFIAHGCQWKIESPPVQATKFARHESDNPFSPASGGTSVALMKNWLSGKMSVFMCKINITQVDVQSGGLDVCVQNKTPLRCMMTSSLSHGGHL